MIPGWIPFFGFPPPPAYENIFVVICRGGASMIPGWTPCSESIFVLIRRGGPVRFLV